MFDDNKPATPAEALFFALEKVSIKPTTPTEALIHFGAKGMKWGVRKDFKAATKNWELLQPEVDRRQALARLNSAIPDKGYASLNTKDIVIKKGQVVTRVTANTGDSQIRDKVFVSTNKTDSVNYRALIPMTTGYVTKSHEGFYEDTMQTTRNLRAPSEKARVDAYIKLMGTPSIALASGENVTGREYLVRSGLGEVVKTLSDRKVTLTYYGQLVAHQGMMNEPMSSAYFSSLQKKGYNALIDDNDRNILSREPLLVLDSKSSLKQISSTRLTTADIHKAQQTLRLP